MPRIARGFNLGTRPDSPFWWVTYTVRGQTRRGSTRVPRTADRGRAEAAAAALVAEAHRSAGSAVPKDVADHFDLAALAGLWLAELEVEAAREKLHPRHVERIKNDVHQHILKRWTHPSEITEESWKAAKTALHHTAKDGHLKERSIAHVGQVLRRLLDFCARAGAIPAVPTIKNPSVKAQRRDEADRRAMTAQERDRFLAALRKLGEARAHRIYTSLFWSALRKGELEAMTRRWVDFRGEIVRIPADDAKGREAEAIDLHPRVAQAIRAQLRARARADGQAVGLDEPIFGAFDFHQSGGKAGGGVFWRAVAAAKIKDHVGLTPHHVTRHTTATLAGARKGASLAELMAIGRWRSPQMAARYLHPSVQDARRALRRL